MVWFGRLMDFSRMAWAGARQLDGRKNCEAEEASETRARLGRELVSAGESREFDEIKRLLELGADIGWISERTGCTILGHAVARRDEEAVRRYVKWGADPNGCHILNPNGNTWDSLLCNLALGGDVDMARVLLELGARIDQKSDFSGMTAVMWAAKGAETKMLRFLVGEGGRLDDVDKEGRCALMNLCLGIKYSREDESVRESMEFLSPAMDPWRIDVYGVSGLEMTLTMLPPSSCAVLLACVDFERGLSDRIILEAACNDENEAELGRWIGRWTERLELEKAAVAAPSAGRTRSL